MYAAGYSYYMVPVVTRGVINDLIFFYLIDPPMEELLPLT